MKCIIWDFDGVLVESELIREKGFRYALRNFDADKVELLLEFHRANGGMSRYAKFAYFFSDLNGGASSDIDSCLRDYSVVMAGEMFNTDLLNDSVISFIRSWKGSQYIASGSDEIELRKLCSYFNISDCFSGIYGSPKPKNAIVADIVNDKVLNDFVLIGDSINDYTAAKANGIDFLAFSKDISLLRLSDTCFKELAKHTSND